MKNIILIITLIFLMATVFAAAPTLSDINWSPKAVNDLNYSKWTGTDFINIYSTVTGEDLNAEDCYFTLNNGDTWIRSTVDMNTDTNIISVHINMPSVTNDVNFGLKCVNNSAEESDPVYQRIYLDETPPTTTATFDDKTTITFNVTEAATTIGKGSGVKSLLYNLDSSGWVDLGAVTTASIEVTSVGSHSVSFCSIDNLDNNECATPNVKPFYVGNFNSRSCALSTVLIFVMIAVIILYIIFGMIQIYKGEAGFQTMIYIGIGILGVLIMIFLSGTVNQIMCG